MYDYRDLRPFYLLTLYSDGGLARSSASMASVGGISDGFFEASGGFGFDGHGTAAKLKKCDVDVKEEKPMQHSFGFEKKKPTQSSFGFPSTTVGQHHRVGGSLVAAKRGENRGGECRFLKLVS